MIHVRGDVMSQNEINFQTLLMKFYDIFKYVYLSKFFKWKDSLPYCTIFPQIYFASYKKKGCCIRVDQSIFEVNIFRKILDQPSESDQELARPSRFFTKPWSTKSMSFLPYQEYSRPLLRFAFFFILLSMGLSHTSAHVLQSVRLCVAWKDIHISSPRFRSLVYDFDSLLRLLHQ